MSIIITHRLYHQPLYHGPFSKQTRRRETQRARRGFLLPHRPVRVLSLDKRTLSRFGFEVGRHFYVHECAAQTSCNSAPEKSCDEKCVNAAARTDICGNTRHSCVNNNVKETGECVKLMTNITRGRQYLPSPPIYRTPL